ncbi:MAG: pyruvate kinase [Candidatus Magasanikbacteria bacterium]|nr:pyruvate kinase [Candidatus Magasanikbacteria bacterium]
MKRTKIVATIGPASEKLATLKKLVAVGLNVCRLNFSHGTYANHSQLIKNIRTVAKQTNEPLAILQDLSGPKIRVGDLPAEGVALKVGAEIIFANDGGKGHLPFTYVNLPKDVKKNDIILLDDGLMQVRVTTVKGKLIYTKIEVGGVLLPHKGMNVPTASLSVPSITDKDKKDLQFGLGKDVDIVSLSFVRTAEDVKQLKGLIKKWKRGVTPLVVAKIEKHEAVTNMSAIVDEVDGIMVARGDLALEAAAEEVPLVQKRLIKMCRERGKFVIVATEMLASMAKNPRPTRAEVSDVANAVIDHTDCVMLSGESATGKYPVETVLMMGKICHETEASEFDNLPVTVPAVDHNTASELLGDLAMIISRLPKVKAIALDVKHAHLAPLISQFRPEASICPMVKTLKDAQQFNVRWGVHASVTKTATGLINTIKKRGLAKKGDRVAWIAFEKNGSNLNVKEVII